jgi:hypothetical protein
VVVVVVVILLLRVVPMNKSIFVSAQVYISTWKALC